MCNPNSALPVSVCVMGGGTFSSYESSSSMSYSVPMEELSVSYNAHSSPDNDWRSFLLILMIFLPYASLQWFGWDKTAEGISVLNLQEGNENSSWYCWFICLASEN